MGERGVEATTWLSALYCCCAFDQLLMLEGRSTMLVGTGEMGQAKKQTKMKIKNDIEITTFVCFHINL